MTVVYLGVGLSHNVVIEGMFEIPLDRPLRRISDYLDILTPALLQEPIDVHGESVSYHGVVDVAGAPAPQLMLAALGPQMLACVVPALQGPTRPSRPSPKSHRSHASRGDSMSRFRLA